MNEAQEHILEILGDIVAMDFENISESDLLESAKNYNIEFDYNLTENQLKEIVKKATS